MKIAKVISGGQTGADQAGLYAAEKAGIPTGGTAPKGWRTQAGPNPLLGSRFGLVEHSSSAYPPRTALNVAHSDITIVLGNPNSPGCKLTRREASSRGKEILIVKNFNETDFINCYRKLVEEMPSDLIINVAGNREESTPGIFKRSQAFLFKLFTQVNKV